MYIFQNFTTVFALSEQECQNEFLKNTDSNSGKFVENKVEPSDGK